MDVLLIGVGAAGNKAVVTAIEKGAVKVEDTIIVNSTTKDFPKDYTGKKIVLNDNANGGGCGKERKFSNALITKAIKEGKFNFNDSINKYSTVIIATSIEGGTGSGATPMLAKFFNKVYTKNVHIIAFTGFEDDPRGLQNAFNFFKEIDPALIVHTISNAAYLGASKNRTKAEELANEEMARRIRVFTGQDFIDGKQNIDDTDLLKLSNTSGYMVVEKKEFDSSLETKDDFESVIKNMVYNSSSIKTLNPSAIRLGVILNISPASEDAIDYAFTSLRKSYGDPFEMYIQIQWDKKQEYIAYIASGMKMPIDEVKGMYDRFNERAKGMRSVEDEFFKEVSDMSLVSGRFDMVKEENKGMSITDFLAGK